MVDFRNSHHEAPTPRHRGRLELTWANKDERLVSHGDGSYEWVPPSDHRVAEVHLLHDAGKVGDDADGNLLIRGDALHALTSLGELDPYADRFLGEVKLAYLDPPFNTQQAFAQYDDALEHSVWLTMMRDRLVQIKRLLSPQGSVWVHCDDSEQAHLRVLMDEVFGREQFIATIIWKRRNDPRNSARFISTDHDTILVFANDADQLAFNALPRTAEMDAAYSNPDDDPRGPWRRSDLAARNFLQSRDVLDHDSERKGH